VGQKTKNILERNGGNFGNSTSLLLMSKIMTIRKQFLLLIACCLLAMMTIGQFYTNELLAYQDKYKKNLFPIIGPDTAFVKFYPVDSSFRVTAKVEKLVTQSFFPMATSDKNSKEAIKYALVKFTLHNKEYKLFAYQLADLLQSTEYKSHVFIPFTDATTGIDSYIGGRYIDFVIADILPGDKLVIDFNKAYNPYCAFNKGFSCPIPPAENKLPAKIFAGEMDFSK
jgi:uncharacterized protein